MKLLYLRIAANVALLACLLAWMSGGARLGFYQNYYTVQEYDPVLDFSAPVQIDRFLPGIETLVAGLVLFAALQVVASVLESRKPKFQS